MQVIAALTSALALASFGWGVTHFFKRPGAPSGSQRATALLGLIFGSVQLVELATGGIVPWRAAAAAAAHVAATWIFWMAVRACRRHRLTAIFEPDAPKRLVQSGPYRYIRHPFYTAYSIYWIAGAAACSTPETVVAPAVMIAIYIRAAAMEEGKFAASPLAGEYREYRQRTGAFVPRPQARSGNRLPSCGVPGAR